MATIRIPVPIDDYVKPIDLKNFSLPSFVPRQYYVTSGHAVWKTHFMISELHDLKARLKAYKPTSIRATTQKKARTSEINTALKGAAKLLAFLEEVQGKAVFLELEWGADRILYASPKNPRDAT